jgi:hypothetical protein
MLITLFVLDWGFYSNLSGQFDDGLKELAGKIAPGFRNEIVKADNQLGAVSGDVSCRLADANVTHADFPDFTHLMLIGCDGRPICSWVANWQGLKLMLGSWFLKNRCRRSQYATARTFPTQLNTSCGTFRTRKVLVRPTESQSNW